MAPEDPGLDSGSTRWWVLLCLLAVASPACLWPRGQRFSDFTIQTPLPSSHTLVLGFLGGRNAWDDDSQGVRKLALRLRERQLPIRIETVENTKRKLASRLIEESLDRNQNGHLETSEKNSARLILYGQSFGGAAVVKLARQLRERDIPVALTIQVDSIGLEDGRIPPNVDQALNLYQTDGWIIQGEAEVRAEDPTRTEVTNRKFSYRNKPIDISHVPWYKLLFRVAHTKMGLDPEVWELVEETILSIAISD